jgi:hypothetical protein
VVEPKDTAAAGGKQVTSRQSCRPGKLKIFEQEIAARYCGGENCIRLAAQFGVAPGSICKLLHRLHVPIRPPSQRAQGLIRKPRRRKCSLDEGVFDVLTEKSAYWIGFLMADGCISEEQNAQPTIALGLAATDRLHVEMFRQFLGSSHKIYETCSKSGFSSGSAVHFSVRSSRLVSALRGYGIEPRKSFTARVSGLEENRHFWRGVIDGDGHLGMRQQNGVRPYPKIGMVGSRALLEQFAGFVRRLQPDCRAQVAPLHSIWQFSTSGRFAQAITQRLYADCTVALARKATHAEEVLKWQRAVNDWSAYRLPNLEEAYLRLGSWSAVALSFGMPISSLKGVLRNLRHKR